MCTSTHLEVAFLCGVMAAELGLNVKQAKRAGLLHDIGKAVDHEIEGSHAKIGADLAKKYGESPAVVHSIAAHHEEERQDSILDVIVEAADALSGARPGARREMLETYVKRLEDLERIAHSFSGGGEVLRHPGGTGRSGSWFSRTGSRMRIRLFSAGILPARSKRN